MNNLELLAWAKEWMSQDRSRNFFDGQWKKINSDRKFSVVSPATKETLVQYSLSSEADVDDAVTAAKKCFKNGDWRNLNKRTQANYLTKIGTIIRDHQQQFAALESLSNGKLYHEALNDDLPDSADIFDYYSGWVDKIYGDYCPVNQGFVNYTVKEPIGVVGLIVPWNYPLLMATWKIAPALATGNSVVIKPSEYTSLSLIYLFELLDKHLDLPSGLLNLVIGDGLAGAAMSNSLDIAKISFTGSTDVGKEIMKASGVSNLKKLNLELGGKSANIIFADAPNLEYAIDRSFQQMFSQKGEKCSEPTRFLVERKIYQQVSDALVAKAEKVICGQTFNNSATQGAQCYEGHFNKILSYIAEGKKSSKLIAGGESDKSSECKNGYFIRPTIFMDVDPSSVIAQEEIFGPVLCLIPFDTDSQALEIANHSKYGLASGIWTKDLERIYRFSNQLETGMVFINHYGCYDFSSPFGGFKMSGGGTELAKHSIDTYTKTKSIWIRHQ